VFVNVATTALADKFDLETLRKDANATAKWSAHHRVKVFEDALAITVATENRVNQEPTDFQVNQVSPVGQVLLVQLEPEDQMVQMVKLENVETWVKQVLLVNKVHRVREVRLDQTGKVEFQVNEDEPVQPVFQEVLAKMENGADQELSAPEDRRACQERMVNKVIKEGQVLLVPGVNQEFKADEEISETLFKLLLDKTVFGDLWDHLASTENKAHPA